MAFNIFTNNPLGPFATALTAARPPPAEVTVTAHDPMYYFLRVATELSGNKLAVRAFEGTQYDERRIPAGELLVVDTSGGDSEILDELNFLVGVGGAMPAPNEPTKYYVHERAKELFYSRFFPNAADPASRRAVMNYMRDVVLPGYYWRSFYVTDGLSASIEMTKSALVELLGIQSAYETLVDEIGLD